MEWVTALYIAQIIWRICYNAIMFFRERKEWIQGEGLPGPDLHYFVAGMRNGGRIEHAYHYSAEQLLGNTRERHAPEAPIPNNRKRPAPEGGSEVKGTKEHNRQLYATLYLMARKINK